MCDVTLLSNGSYHVVVTAKGSGRSDWNHLAVTRWREGAALDDYGTFFFRDTVDSAAASMRVPLGSSAANGPIATQSSIAVAIDCDLEVRRLQLTNRSSRPCALAVTSYSEIVLSPAETEAAHPAFSKLFIETEVDEELGEILASRRPSAVQDSRPWYFHTAVVHGAQPGMSYETNRMRLVGRGRNVSQAEALRHGRSLSGHAGAVLDAIAAIRVPLNLEAGASCTIDWFTGIAKSALAVPVIRVASTSLDTAQLHAWVRASLDHAGGVDDAAALERLLALLRYVSGDYRQPETFQRLKAALESWRARPDRHPVRQRRRLSAAKDSTFGPLGRRQRARADLHPQGADAGHRAALLSGAALRNGRRQAARADWHEGVLGARLVTVFPRQRHYPHDPANLARYPTADLSVDRIGALLELDPSSWLGAIPEIS